ncbi:MAG: DUF6164 family protein [Mariprofundus sp.]
MFISRGKSAYACEGGDRKNMAEKLFKLRNVPEDEAEDIRQLLQSHGIEYYETEAGGWGISMPAIWIHDHNRMEEARGLIDAYQQERTRQARDTFQSLKAAGKQRRMRDKICENPVQFLLFLLMALFILYVSLAPFMI